MLFPTLRGAGVTSCALALLEMCLPGCAGTENIGEMLAQGADDGFGGTASALGSRVCIDR